MDERILAKKIMEERKEDEKKKAALDAERKLKEKAEFDQKQAELKGLAESKAAAKAR